jgi:TonB family protein
MSADYNHGYLSRKGFLMYKLIFALGFLCLSMVVSGQSTQPSPVPTNDPPAAQTTPVTPYQQPKKISVSGGVMAGMILTKVQPVYPTEAKEKHVQGTVVLAAEIGMDGHIDQLLVIQGPEPLQKAAYDAVKKWVYRPYLLNGNPVSVNTQVNVVFSLAR